MSPVQRALGLDIGGTHTKLGIIAASGEILYQEILVTASHGDPAPYFKDMHERIQRLRAYYQPEGIGFSLPGLLSADRRVIEYNPNTPALVGADFWQEFSDFELPMAFETDLNTPALAEYHFGGYTKNTRLLAAAIGTGLGAAVVAEGRLVRLFGGVAGDNGHIILQPGGPSCTAGCRGCAEALVSAPAVERLYRQAENSLEAAALRAQVQGGIPAARAVIQAAARGDPCAQQIMLEIGDWLGMWLASLASLFKPDVIVLCGGVAEAGESLRRPAEEKFRQLAGPAYTQHCQVVEARLCGQAGMVGAVVPLFQENQDE